MLAALIVLATARLFVWPGSASPDEADAVVLFGGGRGERLDAALELMERGVAPVLVISNGNQPGWGDANRLCRGGAEAEFEVLCPTPEPDTTRGEARTTARLAERRGWERLVLVTSTYHARRAGELLRRCHDGDVEVVAARPKQSALRTWHLAFTEWGAYGRAVFVDRAC